MLWYTKGVDRMKKKLNWKVLFYLGLLTYFLLSGIFAFFGVEIPFLYKRWSSRFLRTISFNSLLYVERIHHSIVHSIYSEKVIFLSILFDLLQLLAVICSAYLLFTKNHFLKQLTDVQKMVFVVLCISVILPALYEFITGFAQGFWERL